MCLIVYPFFTQLYLRLHVFFLFAGMFLTWFYRGPSIVTRDHPTIHTRGIHQWFSLRINSAHLHSHGLLDLDLVALLRWPQCTWREKRYVDPARNLIDVLRKLGSYWTSSKAERPVHYTYILKIFWMSIGSYSYSVVEVSWYLITNINLLSLASNIP